MCGICGARGRGAAATVNAMIARLDHRGPDGSGRWESDDLALGHTRLSIVDLSEAGAQPMHHREGGLVAVVNGEIYNYRELRSALERRGAVFNSNSDSEVVLHAYARWGREAFAKLNGMFAFALWDEYASTLLLVRDRVGIKPLYYLETQDRFAFASELKALIPAQGRKSWPLDSAGLAQYLTFQNYFGDRSLLAGVHPVEPGQVIELRPEGNVKWCFWQPETGAPSAEGMAFTEAVDAFSGTLEAAVERHLMSDVPVACYLSAGFDSTSVTALAARHLGEPPIAYTGYFDRGGWYDETGPAAELAAATGTDQHRVPIDDATGVAAIDRVVHALDEPRMGMGALPQFLVAERAARNHKVILTGHGGDELFSGYPVFKLALFMDGLAGRERGGMGGLFRLEKAEIPHLMYFLGRQFGPQEGRYFLPVLFGAREQAAALQPAVAEAVGTTQPWQPLHNGYGCDVASRVEQVYLTYLRSYLQGLLTVEDKISMAHSLEARTPFLDNEMIELSQRIPQPVKMTGGELKAVVKQAGRAWLPDSLYRQPKRGFPTPLRHWLRGPMHEAAKARLIGPETRLTRLFRREWLEREWNRFQASPRHHVRPLDEIAGHRMWQLLSLESWLRQCEEGWGVTIEVPG